MTPQNDLPIAPPPTLTVRTRWKRSPVVIFALIVAALGFVTFLGIGSSLFLNRRRYRIYSIPSEAMLPTLRVGDRVGTDNDAFKNGTLPKHEDIVVFTAPPEVTSRSGKAVLFIKRVIALPGETVQVKGASITIGGTVFSEENGHEPHQYLRDHLGPTPKQAVRIYPNYVEVDNGWEISTDELAEKIGRLASKIRLEPGYVLVDGKATKERFQIQEDASYNFPAEGGALKIPAGYLFVLGDNRNRSADSHLWGPINVKRLRGRVIFKPRKKAQ